MVDEILDSPLELVQKRKLFYGDDGSQGFSVARDDEALGGEGHTGEEFGELRTGLFGRNQMDRAVLGGGCAGRSHLVLRRGVGLLRTESEVSYKTYEL